MEDLFQKKLLLITGKGGVGKSTISALLAYKASELGKKVLIVEATPSPTIPFLFDLKTENYHLTHQIKNIHPGIDTLNMIFADVSKDFFHHYFPKRLVDKVFSYDAITGFLSVLPGVEETIFLGKLVQLVSNIEKKKSPYDIVIFDSPSTGHAVQLFETPKVLLSFIKKGFIYERTKSILTVIEDPDVTALNVVTQAEEAIVKETKELFYNLTKFNRIPIYGLFINCLETQAGLAEKDSSQIKIIESELAKKTVDIDNHILLQKMIKGIHFQQMILQRQRENLTELETLTQIMFNIPHVVTVGESLSRLKILSSFC